MKSPVVILSVLLITICSLLTSCERDTFSPEYHDIYGAWIIRDVSGGFTGGGFIPDFDLLEIRYGMKYKLYRNDTLLAGGRIEIFDEASTDPAIELVPSKAAPWNLISGIKYVKLSKDTLCLYDGCCDGFNYLFVRDEIYSDKNLIQEDKNLDFLEVKTFPIGLTRNFTSLFFTNESTGFLTSFEGSILKTNDGGKTWIAAQTGNTLPLYDIAFSGENTGFAVGGQSYCGGNGCTVPGYIMYKTKDGGKTWERVALPYKWSDLRKIRFYSGFGLTAGTGAMLRTTDGGESWTSFEIGNMTGPAHSIFILNENIAYISGSNGQLFKTCDKGNSWQSIGIDSRYNVQEVMFVDEHTGFLSQWNSFMKTSDGGASWKNVDYAPLSVTAMYFTSRDDGVAFGSRSYATSIWDVWDSVINILIDGKWYGDSRISSHGVEFCLAPDLFYTITPDNRICIIRLNR